MQRKCFAYTVAPENSDKTTRLNTQLEVLNQYTALNRDHQICALQRVRHTVNGIVLNDLAIDRRRSDGGSKSFPAKKTPQ